MFMGDSRNAVTIQELIKSIDSILKINRMKKIIVLTVALIISSLTIFAQSGSSKKMDTAMHKVYTCTMHPEVISDKPGKCPKCGMDLVEKKSAKKGMDPMQKKDSTMPKKKVTS